MKLNIQMFGGRGSSSGANNSPRPQTGLKGYYKDSIRDINEKLIETAFKSGNKDLITNGYSIFQLNKTGFEYSKDKALTQTVKGFEQQLKEYNSQAKNFKDISSYITDKENYAVNKDYSFDTKAIKKAKTLMGKGTQASVVYKEVGFGNNTMQQPVLVIRNKKGEKGFLLPQRKY